MNRTLSGAAADVALLIARLLLGTIMFAHGYQKLMVDGIGRTSQGFESMSIPVAIVSAAFVTVVEMVGSILVVTGALLTVVAACYLVVMVGAAVFVHIPNGVFVADNGWELVAAIGALLIVLAAAGSGRYGVDGYVRRRQARTTTGRRAVPPTVPPPGPTPRHDHSARAAAFTATPAPELETAEIRPIRRSPSPGPSTRDTRPTP